ncbi:uncharacterized protein LOC143180125 [Calliopsis andreniformis]|uniref:uncharacterized protein LOC143180125 n=1 Tax=Calliopsis andreniformis TaxID=337506 RepID=UPI003FCDD8C8
MTIGNLNTTEKPFNPSYKDDLKMNLQWNVWTLRTIGTWPRSLYHSWSDTVERLFLNVLCHGLLGFILISCGMYIVLEIKDFYNQLKLGSALSFFMMAVMKYCVLFIREDDIRRCVERIETDWKNIKYTEDRQIMLKNAKFSRRLILICGVFMYGSVLFYYIALPLTRAKIVDEDGNLTYRRLVYPFPKILLDARRSPINEVFYTIQLLSGFVAHNITVAACGLAALLAMHACGQLQILMVWLEKLVDGRKDSEQTLDERLASVVEQHVRVINFIELTEDLLHEISLVEVVGCTLNICFLGYYSMMEWNPKEPISGMTYIILLISVTFNIFIFCYIGELLAEQTVKVGEKSYMIDWHRMPGKKSLAIPLMMSMSNSTTKITAGNLIELSISSFGDVIKTSVAYLNMLRNPNHIFMNILSTSIMFHCTLKLHFKYDLSMKNFITMTLTNDGNYIRVTSRNPLYSKSSLNVLRSVRLKNDNRSLGKQLQPFAKPILKFELSARHVCVPLKRCHERRRRNIILFRIMIRQNVVQNGRNILTNNMNDKKYANLSIQWARWLLKSIGLWPQAPNASMLDKIFHRIINVICFGLILLLLIPCGLYAILEVEDVYNKIRLFGPLSFCIMAITKYYSLAYHEENIRKCFEQIKWDWKNVRHVEDRDVMVANDKFGRHLLTVCCYFAYGSFVFYYIAVPINVGRVTVEDENLTFIPHVFPVSRYVIDARYSPANEIFFIAQFFGGLLIHGVSAVTCSLATVFAVHAYGQMEVLMCWLKHLINGREDMCKTEDVYTLKTVHFMNLISLTSDRPDFLYGMFDNRCQKPEEMILLKTPKMRMKCAFILQLIAQKRRLQCNFVILHFQVILTCRILEISDTFCQTPCIFDDHRKSVATISPNNQGCSSLISMSHDIIINFNRNIVLVERHQRLLTLEKSIYRRSRTILLSTLIMHKGLGQYQTSFQACTMQNTKRTVSKHPINVYDYEKYLDISVKWSRWLLRPIGLWPQPPEASIASKLFYRLINAACFCLLSFLLIPCTLYMVLEVKDFYNKVKLSGPLIYVAVALVKYYFLISHKRDIRECIERIAWDWRTVTYVEDRHIMLANANFGRRLVIFCAFFMYSGSMFYYIIVPISVGKVTAEDQNFTYIPLVLPVSTYITDTRHSPLNEIIFSIQALGGALKHGIPAAACSLIATFAVHACGQMEVLLCWLEHLVDGREDMSKTVNKRVATIVDQHVKILKFLALIEKVLRQVSLAEFLGCTLQLCLVGYYIIVEWNSKDVTAAVTYIIIFVSFIIHIFIFCYIGELIVERCKKISEMSYMIDWYRLPGKEKLDLILVMTMSNSTMKLTAGNLMELSLISFSDIVRTSVAFLNMLRTLA